MRSRPGSGRVRLTHTHAPITAHQVQPVFRCSQHNRPATAIASQAGLDNPDPALSRRTLLTGSLTAAGLALEPQPRVSAAEVAAPPVLEQPLAIVSPPARAKGPLSQAINSFRDPYINQGLVTSPAAREASHLQGLLPGGVVNLDVELLRARTAVARAATPLDKYQVLMTLRETNATCFYTLLQEDIEELLPILYTPTVGDACLAWGSLLPRPTGLYLNHAQHQGRVRQVVDTWPHDQVRIAVITDGERILGLGDLGAHGMGIPVGKATVYGGCGVDARQVLPVCVDVGCNREAVRNDPLYVGLRQPRIADSAYFTFMSEVVAAIQARYGGRVIIHWEDVGNRHAFKLLSQLRAKQVATFNDDIECTAAITLAALLSAQRLPGVLPLAQQRVLFFGAGQANLGCARLLAAALQQDTGMTEEEVKGNIWLMDSKGLILSNRSDLSPEKADFAADPSSLIMPTGSGPPRDLLAAVRAVRPTCLIGAASVAGAFSQEVIEALVMSAQHHADDQREKQTRWTLDALGYPRQTSSSTSSASSPSLQAFPSAYLNYSSSSTTAESPYTAQESLFCQPELTPSQSFNLNLNSNGGVVTQVSTAGFMPTANGGDADLYSYIYPVGGEPVSESVSGSSVSETANVIDGLAELRPMTDARPIVLALSNPTSQAECSYEDAYRWSDGKVVYGSGTRFPSLQVDSNTRQPVTAKPGTSRPTTTTTTLTPGQCNNCYVFPGIGLGALLSGAEQVTEGMLLAAARAVAASVPDAQLRSTENILPPISQLRAVTASVASAVAAAAVADQVASPAGALLMAAARRGGRLKDNCLQDGLRAMTGQQQVVGRAVQPALTDVQGCLQDMLYSPRNEVAR